MTDAVREQIKRDADQYATVQYGDRDKLGVPEAFTIWDAGQEDFEAGATHQHPIAEKAGYNQAIDLIISKRKNMRDHHYNHRDTFGTYTDGWLEHNGEVVRLEIEIKELEAMKTEIKK